MIIILIGRFSPSSHQRSVDLSHFPYPSNIDLSIVPSNILCINFGRPAPRLSDPIPSSNSVTRLITLGNDKRSFDLLAHSSERNTSSRCLWRRGPFSRDTWTGAPRPPTTSAFFVGVRCSRCHRGVFSYTFAWTRSPGHVGMLSHNSELDRRIAARRGPVGRRRRRNL